MVSADVSEDVSELSAEEEYPEYLYMKIEKDAVIVESRTSKGEIMDTSKYTISKIKRFVQ